MLALLVSQNLLLACGSLLTRQKFANNHSLRSPCPSQKFAARFILLFCGSLHARQKRSLHSSAAIILQLACGSILHVKNLPVARLRLAPPRKLLARLRLAAPPARLLKNYRSLACGSNVNPRAYALATTRRSLGRPHRVQSPAMSSF
ncbi:hypothetical protein B0H19DRAFT_1263251 [Mycena capillaripes]|nr:hypothetical protein B0H19DRAFT_1263251 [Mycena capillaripes]